VFFSESIIVFTSNIGTRVNEIEQLREAQQSSDRNMVREHFEKCVSSFFRYEISRPELLNRIGKNIVPFNFLDQENVLLDTVNFYLESFEKSFNEAYEKKNLSIRIEKENIGRHILEKYGREIREFGGRAIINVLDDILLPDVSGKILLYSQHPTPRKITLTVSVTIRKGEEAISVSP
jgi:ATP-dependent Clp protease ATP-binding subunit ClpA